MRPVQQSIDRVIDFPDLIQTSFLLDYLRNLVELPSNAFGVSRMRNHK